MQVHIREGNHTNFVSDGNLLTAASITLCTCCSVLVHDNASLHHHTQTCEKELNAAVKNPSTDLATAQRANKRTTSDGTYRLGRTNDRLHFLFLSIQIVCMLVTAEDAHMVHAVAQPGHLQEETQTL